MHHCSRQAITKTPHTGAKHCNPTPAAAHIRAAVRVVGLSHTTTSQENSLMRSLTIPFSIWLAALQLPLYPSDIRSISGAGELVSIAVGLAGLTVAVYR